MVIDAKASRAVSSIDAIRSRVSPSDYLSDATAAAGTTYPSGFVGGIVVFEKIYFLRLTTANGPVQGSSQAFDSTDANRPMSDATDSKRNKRW